ncbi:capsule assembly Wzi family protein [Labilibaculum sp.]|uniref:capsule assembly Wzi family protein n=1 Tax=Labilibaculum sp. TaxID=2060723 RepID=UPI003566C179
MSKIKICLFLFFVCTLSLYSSAQKRELNYELGLSSSVSGDSLPFWLHTNKYGIVPEDNNGLIQLKVFSDFKESDSDFNFSYAASIVVSQSKESDLLVDELFFSTIWKKLNLDLGVKHHDVQYDGLSATNGDLLFSTNSRSYPELSIGFSDFVPVPFTNNLLSIKGVFSNGIMLDNRYVDNTNVHHKSAFLRVGRDHGFSFIIGLDHYVEWGGTSPVYGNLGGFDTFLDAVLVRSGEVLTDTDGNESITESLNKGGNHLGQNVFKFAYNKFQYQMELGFKSMNEDKSGDMKHLKDIKDWNVSFFLKLKQSKFLSSFMYEYFCTKDQSGYNVDPDREEEPVIGFDNYFANGVYRSGWTSYQRTIGLPLITPSLTDGIVTGISNNAIEAHHFGLTGEVGKFKYKAMFTYSKNYGNALLKNDGNGYEEENYYKTYTYPDPLKQQSYLLELSLPPLNNFPFLISTSIAMDQGDYLDDNFGFQIHLTHRGLFSKK